LYIHKEHQNQSQTIQQLLSKIQINVFNSYFTTKAQVIEFLKNHTNNTAHPFNDGNQKVIIFWIDGTIIEKNNLLEIDYFYTNFNSSATEQQLIKELAFHSQTDTFKDFTIEFAQQGLENIIKIIPNRTFVFAVSDKQQGSYIDLQAISQNNINTYHNKNNYGLKHSGDILNSNHLFHGISLSEFINYQIFDIAIVGYGAKKLNEEGFKKQNPFLVLVDHEKEKLIIISSI
jgi:hypothetical protein